MVEVNMRQLQSFEHQSLLPVTFSIDANMYQTHCGFLQFTLNFVGPLSLNFTVLPWGTNWFLSTSLNSVAFKPHSKLKRRIICIPFSIEAGISISILQCHHYHCPLPCYIVLLPSNLHPKPQWHLANSLPHSLWF